MARIGIITHTPRIKSLAEEVATETGHELIVEFGIPDRQVLNIAHQLQSRHQVGALIAPGGTYEVLLGQVNLPLIRLEMTNFELQKALHQAYKKSNKVVLVEFRRSNSVKYDPEMLKQIFEYSVDRITMLNVDEQEQIVDMIVKRGYEVVISAARCILHKVPSNIGTIELMYNKTDLIEAVSLAAQEIEAKTREKEKIQWMQAVVENIQEGILTLDKKGTVESFNALAIEITGIAAQEIVGRNITELLSNEVIGKIYGDGGSSTFEMVSLPIGKLIVNRSPIFVGREQRGLIIKIQKVAKIQALEHEIRKGLYAKGFVAKETFTDIAGKSPKMLEVIAMAQKYASSLSNILITGESGTGKELFAQSIHNSSPCRNGPFVAVNCAALSESLLESELYGYEEGAFTGAKKGGKAGLFELAHNGTIFLDEIGDMPLPLQSSLLRVIQQKEVIRLGGNQVIPINNRIICATNKNLAEEVEKGLFRKDLYYRINILRINIPPLRERPEDIPVLGQMIFNKKCRAFRKNIAIDPSLLETLKRYSWPGNAREIEAFVERLLAVTDKPVVEYEDIVRRLRDVEETSQPTVDTNNNLSLLKEGKVLINIGAIADMNNEIIDQVYRYVGCDKHKVEQILRISRTTLWRRIKEISSPNVSPKAPN